jgi:hypothetical protein
MVIRSRTLLTSLSLAALAASACSIQPGTGTEEATDEVAEIQAALEAEDGGMTEADEASAFDDPAVIETLATESTYAEPADADADAVPPPESNLVRRRVLLVWGNLPMLPQSDPEKADWNGGVSCDNGCAIRLVKTVRFDKNDSILPRKSPSLLEWQSHTLPHVDGVLLDVVGPADTTLAFDTAALETSIALDELDDVKGGMVMLEDGVNGLAYAAHRKVADCPEGFLVGRWKSVGDGAGRFRGRVLDDDGELNGHVKGIYGKAPKSGENRFFGKYINTAGKYRGRFGGTYGDGKLIGRWKTVNGPEHEGALAGRYSDGLVDGDGRGLFVGRWAEKCGCDDSDKPEPKPTEPAAPADPEIK